MRAVSVAVPWVVVSFAVGALLWSCSDDAAGTGTNPPPPNLTCGLSEECNLECNAGGCENSCIDQASCTGTCEGGNCDLSCLDEAECVFTCNGGGCDFVCAPGADCVFTCDGGNCTGIGDDNNDNNQMDAGVDMGEDVADDTEPGGPPSCRTNFGSGGACGGDADGEWTLIDSCARIDTNVVRTQCPSTQIFELMFDYGGSLSVADGQAELSVTSSTSVELIVLPDCVAVLGQCQDLPIYFEDGQPWNDAECTPRAGGCDCTVENAASYDTSGAYSSSNNTMTIGGRSFFYCVAGDYLTLREDTDGEPHTFIFER